MHQIFDLIAEHLIFIVYACFRVILDSQRIHQPFQRRVIQSCHFFNQEIKKPFRSSFTAEGFFHLSVKSASKPVMFLKWI